MTGPADPGPEVDSAGEGADALVPIVLPPGEGSAAVEPLPTPQDLERGATAQRNKDALGRLGRTAAGLTRDAADTTGSAARAAAGRTAQVAVSARDQVAEAAGAAVDRVERAADTGPRPVGDGVIVAGPGLPTGAGTVRLDPLGPTTISPAEPPASSTTADPTVSPTASSVAVSAAPPGSTTGSALASSVREAGDRAAGAGQVALDKGRQAVGEGQQAASSAGRQAAARAGQAGAAAQHAGAAGQERARDALASTRSSLVGAVDSGRSAVRERTAPPIDLEGLTAEVLRLPGVSRLAPDAAGRGRGLLPGQVAGASVDDEEVRIRLVPRYGVPLRELADRVHEVAARYADGRQTVVEVADLDLTAEEGTP